MYYKIINERMVFSTCATVQMPNGTWVSNPSQQQISDAGWSVYVPPVVPPAPQEEPDYNEVMEAVKKMFSTDIEELTDEEALEVAALFPTWLSKVEKAEQEGTGVAVGERLWYNEKLYKVIQAHVPQRTWTPDQTPALYTEVSIVEWPEIPENIPAESPWMAGDKGTWKGNHYICQLDNCVWNPDVAPQFWDLVA